MARPSDSPPLAGEPGEVAQPWGWTALGAVGVGVGLWTAAPLVTALGVAGLARGLWNLATGPTVERIPDVPSSFLSTIPDEPIYRVKGRDRELHGVNVVVRPVGSGNLRSYYGIETKDEQIVVERQRESEVTYLASAIQLVRVQVSRGRRPTRYEPDQGDHTVAWTLLAYSIDAFEGWLLSDVVTELRELFNELVNTPDQTSACKAELKKLDHFDWNTFALRMTPEKWQQLISEILNIYVSANQHSRWATYKRTGGKTTTVKREDLAMATMLATEDELRGRHTPAATTQEVAQAAEGLLDVQFHPSLPAVQYAHAVWNWIKALNRAFPMVMANSTLRAAIIAQVGNRNVPPGSRPTPLVTTVSQLVQHSV
ncbi:hypothetical protein WME95_31505 [Sorangium sp. So ce327]|uniref:hypothetical protein n=1 Tax=Sorangium sp. So ce327 TaxID=3133301 RepID=UPI003F5EFBA0